MKHKMLKRIKKSPLRSMVKFHMYREETDTAYCQSKIIPGSRWEVVAIDVPKAEVHTICQSCRDKLGRWKVRNAGR